MQLTRQSYRKLIVVAFVLVAAGGLLAADVVLAALHNSLPARDTVLVCDGSKDHWLELPGGPVLGVDTQGPLTVQVGDGFTTTDGRAGVQLKVLDIQSSGSAVGLGPAAFRLDKSRGGAGNYIANQKESVYPGTQRLQFHVILTAGSREYRSMNAATLVSTNVTQLPPAQGTVYTLTNTVQLEDVADPGTAAAVLRPGQAATIWNGY